MLLAFLPGAPVEATSATARQHEQQARIQCGQEDYVRCKNEYGRALVAVGVDPDRLSLTAGPSYFLSSLDLEDPTYVGSLVTQWAKASLWQVYRQQIGTDQMTGAIADAIGASRLVRDVLTVHRWTVYKTGASVREIDEQIRKSVDIEIEAAYLMRRADGMVEHALKTANMYRTREFMNGMWALHEMYKETTVLGDDMRTEFLERRIPKDKHELVRWSLYAGLVEQALIFERELSPPRDYMLDFLAGRLAYAKQRIMAQLEPEERVESAEPWREVLNSIDVRRNSELTYPATAERHRNYDYITTLRMRGEFSDFETIVQYHLTNEFVFAFVIHKSGSMLDKGKVELKLHQLGRRDEIERLVAAFLDQLRNANMRGWGFTSGQVHRALLANILPKNTRLGTLRIVPSGFLYHVPFGVLRDTRTGTLLIDHIGQIYVPHMDMINYLGFGRNWVDPDHTLGVGIRQFRDKAELRYGEAELDLLEQELAGRFVALRGSRNAATIDGLVSYTPGSILTHISTHGQNDPNPLLSGLVMQGGDRDVLYPALELLALEKPLLPGLVVLSACETGSLQPGDNDDVLGLAGTFLMAGAGVVIATQWPVPEESTYHLMRNFYALLFDDDAIPIHEALRQAQLRVREMEGYGHPYHWAGFVVIGRGRLTNNMIWRVLEN